MLSEFELRNVITREKEFLESIVDPHARELQIAFIAGLELRLND